MLGVRTAADAGIYADKGYITTRAYVPAQDIASRELTV